MKQDQCHQDADGKAEQVSPNQVAQVGTTGAGGHGNDKNAGSQSRRQRRIRNGVHQRQHGQHRPRRQ